MMLGILAFQRGHALVQVLDLLAQFGCLFSDDGIGHLSQLGIAFLGGHLADLLRLTRQIRHLGGEHRVVDHQEVEQHQKHQGAEDDDGPSVNTFLL